MQNPNSSMVDPISGPKRYTPPNQRNRSSNRRRSKGSSQSRESERSQLIGVGLQKEDSSSSSRIISLEGCSKSEAFRLLSDRWAAAMHLYNDPSVDLSERPTMCYGKDVWDKLPQNMKPLPHSKVAKF